MEQYSFHYHHPVKDIFTAGNRVFKKIKESDTHFMFKITYPESGNSYYEIFEKRLYKNGIHPSKTLKDGDYYYPVDREFGSWAWCYSDFDYVLKRWEEKHNNTTKI